MRRNRPRTRVIHRPCLRGVDRPTTLYLLTLMAFRIRSIRNMAEPYTLTWFLLHAKSAHLDAYFRRRRLLEHFAFRDGR